MSQKIRQEKKLNYGKMTRYSLKISSGKMFQYSQIVYIKSITQ